MKFKKMLSMFIVIILVITVLAGCGGKKSSTLYDGEYEMDPVLNPLGSEYICKEPVELEIMMASIGRVV